MRPDPVNLEVDGAKFTIRPLTLKQIRAIDLIAKNADMSELDKMIEIVRTGFSRDYPEIAEKIEDQPIPLSQLGDLCNAIMVIGGMAVASPGNVFLPPAPAVEAEMKTDGTSSTEG